MAETPADTAARFNAILNRTIPREDGSSYSYQSYAPVGVNNLAQAASFRGQLDSYFRRRRRSSSSSSSSDVDSTAVDLGDNESDPQSRVEAAKTIFNDPSWVKSVRPQAMGVLDLVSRPMYTFSEGLRSVGEAINRGEDPWTTPDDLIKGVARGFTGKAKTGYGDIIEEFSTPEFETEGTRTRAGNIFANVLNPQSAVSRTIRTYDADSPVARNLNRGYGFAGELLADPLNLAGGKAIQVGRGTGRTIRNVDDLDNIVRQATDEAIEKAGTPVVKTQGGTTKGGGWVSSTDRMKQVGRDTLEDVVMTLQGGGSRGKVIGGLNDPNTVTTIVSRQQNALLESLNTRFEQRLNKFVNNQLSPSQIKRMRKDPQFDEFMKIIEESPPRFGQAIPERLIDEAADAARSYYDDAILQYGDELEKLIDGATYGAPAIRVGTKEFPVRFLGRAYQGVRKSGVGTPKAVSYGKQFPAKIGTLNAKVRRLGIREAEDFFNRVKEVSYNLTKSQREELSRAIHQGYEFPTDPQMQDALDFIKNSYDEMYMNELEAGARTASNNKPDNYQYIFYRPLPFSRKGGSNLKRFREARKAEAQTGRIVSGIDEAAEAGLRPVRDPFQNLNLAFIKSQRNMSRSWFLNDLAQNYGVKAKNLTPKQAADQGLVKVTQGGGPGGNFKVSRQLQNSLKDGESWYLPEDIADYYKGYYDLSTMNFNEELNDFLRITDRITNFFKGSATIPNVGFHVKNMIGDVFHGYLDDVRAADYESVLSRLGMRRAGQEVPPFVVNGQEFTLAQMEDMFKRSAASGGFFGSEIPLASRTPTQKVTSAPRKIAQKARDISEHREDLGRFVHWVKAFRDEFAGKTSVQKAMDNATYRVDKYKFDYGALTKTEKAFMRRMFPFYTYSRKAMPVLLESLFLHPSTFGKADRFFNGDQSDFTVPSWMRELGYVTLPGDSENPLIMPNAAIPTSVLFDNLIPEEGRGPVGGYTNNLLGQSNPLIQSPIELAFNRDLFFDAPLVRGPEFNREGEPGIADEASFLAQNLIPPINMVNNVRKFEKDDPLEFFLGNRLGLGLQVRRLDRETQNKSINSQLREFNNQVQDINRNLEETHGYKIYVSNRKAGSSIRIRNKNEPGEPIVYDGDLNGAMKYLQEQGF